MRTLILHVIPEPYSFPIPASVYEFHFNLKRLKGVHTVFLQVNSVKKDNNSVVLVHKVACLHWDSNARPGHTQNSEVL